MNFLPSSVHDKRCVSIRPRVLEGNHGNLLKALTFASPDVILLSLKLSQGVNLANIQTGISRVGYYWTTEKILCH